MFDELVPRELRELLDGAFGIRRRVMHAVAWADALEFVPKGLDELIDRELAKMERRAWLLVARYRRGELTLRAFERELERAFDFSRRSPSELDALFPRRC